MRLNTQQGDGVTANRNPVGHALLPTVNSNPIIYKNTRLSCTNTTTAQT
jgi:hypothetical protein